MVFSQSKIISDKDVKIIEEQVEKELNNPKNDSAKKFQLNMLTAREAYQFRFYDKSFHYYSNAIAMDVDADKTEAYINRIAISILANDKKRITENYDDAKKYFSKNQKYKTQSVDYYLATIEKSLSLDPSIGPRPVGYLGAYAQDENFTNLLKNKQYQKAFSLIDSEKIKKSKSTLQVTSFDTLNVLLNKKNVKELYCNKDFKKFPDDYSYGILVCRLLNDYLKDGKFSAKNMKRAETYFKAEDPGKQYLLDMIKEIK